MEIKQYVWNFIIYQGAYVHTPTHIHSLANTYQVPTRQVMEIKGAGETVLGFGGERVNK